MRLEPLNQRQVCGVSLCQALMQSITFGLEFFVLTFETGDLDLGETQLLGEVAIVLLFDAQSVERTGI
jgi:hypothetical protein